MLRQQFGDLGQNQPDCQGHRVRTHSVRDLLTVIFSDLRLREAALSVAAEEDGRS